MPLAWGVHVTPPSVVRRIVPFKPTTVPVLESVTCMQAVEFACQVADERHATIILANVVQVPDSVGLDVPLPGAEERGKRLLRQAESIVMQHGMQAETCMLRQRSAENAILELERAIGAETIVLGTGSSESWPLSQTGTIVSGLILHAPCEVVVTRAPLTA